MNPRLRGSIEISIASVGFGFLGIFGKWAFESGMSVGEVLSYRFTLAAVLLWIFLLLFRPTWVRLNLRQTIIAALLGIFGYAFFSTLYFTAVDGLSITLAALLLYTYPFWVNVFSHFFTQDKISRKEALCLVAASSGLVLLLWGHIEVKNIWAIAAGLGAAISYAIYVLLSARLQKNVRPITSALYVITFGALALSLFHHPHFDQIKNLSTIQASSILGLALVCTIIPLTMELAALQKLKSTEVALLMMIEPITAALMGALIFGERLTGVQLIGALIIGVALVINTLATRPEKSNNQPLNP
ncbi:EamA family transporter [Bdellovibrio bacteriovorus]|uniref:EamA family transporter n=1 Tax=Bdellovibrio bacteriovorus TaxID=959 RepID=UPI003AA801EE